MEVFAASCAQWRRPRVSDEAQQGRAGHTTRASWQISQSPPPEPMRFCERARLFPFSAHAGATPLCRTRPLRDDISFDNSAVPVETRGITCWRIKHERRRGRGGSLKSMEAFPSRGRRRRPSSGRKSRESPPAGGPGCRRVARGCTRPKPCRCTLRPMPQPSRPGWPRATSCLAVPAGGSLSRRPLQDRDGLARDRPWQQHAPLFAAPGPVSRSVASRPCAKNRMLKTHQIGPKPESGRPNM